MRQRTERASVPQVEQWSELALIPMLATVGYYALPDDLQNSSVVQFFPQILAYCSLALWAVNNTAASFRLGLAPSQYPQGLQWGFPVGVALGAINATVILWVIPWLGADIEFLRETPHARMPVFVMLPWAILLVAIGVELNFRGFLLGRLVALAQRFGLRAYPCLGSGLAVIVSAIVFSFDPFMVSTFKHLHWIAVWDGLVWGMMWVRLRNLYATITAHAVEVLVMYSVLKLIL
ncbi:MAG TPA: CPBP family intramembrane glutamic endopeptidase [Nitrospira sp.]|jgi:membrane protease YdiL (CAAX protease family)|nr:CPBP family intramembrane glutamic endopeptidase [Nitrospira sp.]